MAQIIDGRAAAAELRESLKAEVAELKARHGIVPNLKVVILGDHPASRAYVRTKARMAAEIGMEGEIVAHDAETSEADLLARLDALNRDPAVHGILVQLPLPAHIDEAKVLLAIDPQKDVDGFHPMNVGRLFSTQRPQQVPGMLLPCTPLGCLILLESVHGEGGLKGRRALIVGRSNIVGKPMAALLLGADCTVTLAHSRTADLPAECRRAEILVAAVGRAEMIRGDWIGEGATVIDVGINRIETEDGKGRLIGDIAYAEAEPRAGAITPVPGGVGPMTVACLLRNTIVAARAQREG